MNLEILTDIKFRADRLFHMFDFKTEDVLEKNVSQSNISSFDRDVQNILAPANELKFVTINDNNLYANEIFKCVQKIFNEGNKILANNPTNGEMKKLVQKQAKDILDYLYLIENNEEDFKPFVQADEHPFDENLFNQLIGKLKLVNKNKDEKIKFYQEELNGGEFLYNFVEKLGLSDESELYGVDRDIDVGVQSRNRGIITARSGLRACSKLWADVAFSTNSKISFQFGESDFGLISFDPVMEIERTKMKRLLQKGGLYIFNAPFYKMGTIKREIETLEILEIINTDDEYGNLIFIVKNTPTAAKNNKNLLLQAQFMPQTLPKQLTKEIYLAFDAVAPPENYRAAFVDIDDVQVEFADTRPSSQFIFDVYKKDSDIEASGRPLQETKEGHIPTLATSGVVSGRYVDEVLHKKVGEKIGFDNLIETKIVKREIEEEETVKHNGAMVKEISLKKSNIIVSTALTSVGEFIELFSNETES